MPPPRRRRALPPPPPAASASDSESESESDSPDSVSRSGSLARVPTSAAPAPPAPPPPPACPPAPRSRRPDLTELRAQFKEKLRRQDEHEARRRLRASLSARPASTPAADEALSDAASDSDSASSSEASSSSSDEEASAAIELDGHDVWNQPVCYVCERVIPPGTGVLANGAPVAQDHFCAPGPSTPSATAQPPSPPCPAAAESPVSAAHRTGPAGRRRAVTPARGTGTSSLHAESSSRESSVSRQPHGPPTTTCPPRAPSAHSLMAASPAASAGTTGAASGPLVASSHYPWRHAPKARSSSRPTPPFGPLHVRTPLATPGGAASVCSSSHASHRRAMQDMKRAAAQSHRVPLYCSSACRAEDLRGSAQNLDRLMGLYSGAPTPSYAGTPNRPGSCSHLPHVSHHGSDTTSTAVQPRAGHRSSTPGHSHAYSYSGYPGATPAAWSWASTGPPSAGLYGPRYSGVVPNGQLYPCHPAHSGNCPPHSPSAAVEFKAGRRLHRTSSLRLDTGYTIARPQRLSLQATTPGRRTNSNLVTSPLALHPSQVATDYFDRAAPGMCKVTTVPVRVQDPVELKVPPKAQGHTRKGNQNHGKGRSLSALLALGGAPTPSARAAPPSTSLSTACAPSFSRTLVPPSESLSRASGRRSHVGSLPLSLGSWGTSPEARRPHALQDRTPQWPIRTGPGDDSPGSSASYSTRSVPQSPSAHASSSLVPPARQCGHRSTGRSGSVSLSSFSGSSRSWSRGPLTSFSEHPEHAEGSDTAGKDKTCPTLSLTGGSEGLSALESLRQTQRACSRGSVCSAQTRARETWDPETERAGWWRSLVPAWRTRTPSTHRATVSCHTGSAVSESAFSPFSTDTSPPPPDLTAGPETGKRTQIQHLARPYDSSELPAQATRGEEEEEGQERARRAHRRSWAEPGRGAWATRTRTEGPFLQPRSTTPAPHSGTCDHLTPRDRSPHPPDSRPVSGLYSPRPTSRPASRGSTPLPSYGPGSLPRRSGLGWGPNRQTGPFSPGLWAAPDARPAQLPPWTGGGVEQPSPAAGRGWAGEISTSLPVHVHDTYDPAFTEALGLAPPRPQRRKKELRPPQVSPAGPRTLVGGFGQVREHPAEAAEED